MNTNQKIIIELNSSFIIMLSTAIRAFTSKRIPLFTCTPLQVKRSSIYTTRGINSGDDVYIKDIDKVFVTSYVMANRFPYNQPQLQCIGGTAKWFTSLHLEELWVINKNMNWVLRDPHLDKTTKLSDISVNFNSDGVNEEKAKRGSEIVRYKLNLKISGLFIYILCAIAFTIIFMIFTIAIDMIYLRHIKK
jgi:hypothetical protein